MPEKLNWVDERRRAARVIGKKLVESNALKFGDFTLSSGKRSSYYIDLRLAPSIPSLFSELVQTFISIVKDVGVHNADAIGGIATSGLTYATAVAYELKLPLVYVRSDAKRYGTRKTLEGIIRSGDRIILIDDLITSGDSILAAANQIRAAGGVVTKSIVLIDRNEGGAEKLSADHIELYSLSSIDELADILYSMHMISYSERQAIHEESQ
ncbi:MAG: orotate phosphoribosyltransferase [Nitrososphaerales archaeon]